MASPILTSQVHMDTRLEITGVYYAATAKTTFNTPVPFYGDTVVLLSNGTTGTLITATGAITSVSVANPTVITSASHGLATGQSVTIAGTNTNATTVGTFPVTVTGANTFTIPVNVIAVTTGTGTWTNADHTGYQVLGDYSGACVIGAQYSSLVQLSEFVARDAQNNVEIGRATIIKSGVLYHRSQSAFSVIVSHALPVSWPTETYPWAPGTMLNSQQTIYNRFKFMVGAEGEKTSVGVISTTWYPFSVSGMEFDYEVAEGLR